MPVSGRSTQRTRSLLLAPAAAVAVALAVCAGFTVLEGQTERLPGRRDVERSQNGTPRRESDHRAGIAVSADFAQQWNDGPLTVMLLRGRCRVRQGETRLSADSMVVWRRSESGVLDTTDRLVVYLEGNARIERPGSTLRDGFLFWEMSTGRGLALPQQLRRVDRPPAGDAVFARAEKRYRQSESAGRALRRTQPVALPGSQPAGFDDLSPQLLSAQMRRRNGGVRRVRISPRSAVSFSVQSFESKQTTPLEQIWVLTGGINMIIEGIERFGVVDLSADRMVVWTRPVKAAQFQSETVQSSETPFEVYLEGNIVVRQGQNVIRADRAVYDARENRGLILDAELRAYVPALKDSVRVRAQRIRQLSQNSFHATGAWTTTSKFGFPGYRLQASDVFLESRHTQPLFGPTEFDPETGAPLERDVRWVTSLNNTLFLERVPLLYFPYLSAPAEDPNIPLKRFTAGQDRIFGFRVRTEWDLFGILGMERPRGVTWNLLADYYSNRGPALGTATRYRGADPFGIPGLYRGEGLLYGVHDEGKDNLGSDRRALEPKTNDRYRLQLRHRQDMPYGMTLLGELGLLSDRNFLEEFYEREFDRRKDVESLLYLKQQRDNFAWTAIARPQLNDFETSTAWLPRGDLYLLSEPLLGGWLTWSTHTSAGYGRLHVGDTPSDPNDLYVPLPYVANVNGAVLMSRHELNSPFSLGPVRVVPYAMGEAAYWDQGFQKQNIDRYVGTAGVRSSLMFWRVFPNVYSEVLNLQGLAHKSLFEVDYAFTDSSRSLSQIPQYNEFDDNAQERFRNRFIVNTFGGVLPSEQDPRRYAVRTGAGQYVMVPYHELVDDQQVFRLAWRNRLQTKVGPPERLRIKDWMTLDLEASFFPRPARDDFGEAFGLLGGFYRWNFSDQTSLLASSQYDLFDNAQQIWNVGIVSGRQSRGSVYLGVRQVQAPGLHSQILTASMTYRMSPKWITTVGTAYDLGEGRNAGQSLTITRVGADFLVHLGANFDAGKNNAGVVVSVEPRIGALKSRKTQLGSLLQTPQ